MLKKILAGIGILILLVIAYVFYTNYPKLEVVSSYAAKKVCSCTFISDRTQESIEAEDLARSPLGIASSTIDRENKRVTTSVFGMHKKVAEYRENLGCVLIQGKDDFNVHFPSTTIQYNNPDSLPFPYGDQIIDAQMDNVDYEKLKAAADGYFDENGAMTEKKTRAILVLHKDTLLYERYAQGYDKDTEMLGWSMTKSIMNAHVGMRVLDGAVSIEDDNLFPEWADDERKSITLENLLHMASGLEWDEVYAEVSPATKMLFAAEDIVKAAKSSPLEYEPGEHWEYSSGTSNLIAGYLRSTFDNDEDHYLYPYQRIFGPLNMKSAVMETDEAGNYIGSSYCYATARDWARFGTLYLHDGVWNGQRLLPEGWVDFTKTPVPASEGVYGAHFWTNANGSYSKDAPSDLYSMNGFEGQRVFIIPSKDLIIVRLGLSENLDLYKLAGEISKAIQ